MPPDRPDRPALSKIISETVKRRIEEDSAEAYAQYVQTINQQPERLQEATQDLLVRRFDSQAYYLHFRIFSYDDVEGWYLTFLTDVSQTLLQEASHLTEGWSRATAEDFLHTLRTRLIGRSSHWKAEAMGHVREAEEKRLAEAPQSPTLQPAKPKRHFGEPKPELLNNKDIVSRQQAADALGVTTRSLDRYVEDNKLSPTGDWGHTRFKTKELLDFMKHRKKRQQRQE